MAIINKMRIHGEKMEDVTVIEKILRSMTPKFNYVVCSIEESKDLDELSIDELQGSLLVHEQKIIQEDKEEQTLKASTNNNALTTNRSADRGRGKGRGVRGVRDGEVETLLMVAQVNEQPRNLLSAGQLQEKGYIITIQKGACEIYDPSRGAIAVVQMASNRLFPLKIDSVQSFLMAEVKDLSWLWHLRYGHLNFGGLKTLQQKHMVTGLPQISIPSQVCEECVVGKQHRSQFPQGKSQEQRMSWAGIRRELTPLIHRNVMVYRRKNRTILNMVRSLLARGKIPKSFWPEAVNWSIHVLNRSPTFSVQNMTPEEAWSGRKPAVDHFKIFGCIAYAHVPDEKRKKLDDKGEKCVFLGVSEASKAYKLFNPLTKKIVTRDMLFLMRRALNWNGQQPTQVIFDNDAEEERQQLLQQQIPTVSIPESPPNDVPTAAETSSTAERVM
ncbi:hypothetical protein AAG906_004445 [Vitis piasezkii]